MRIALCILCPLLLLSAATETQPDKIWAALAAARAKLPSYHQEFTETVTSETSSHKQSSELDVAIDGSQNLWRQKRVAGYGQTVTIFDGENSFSLEEGGDEYLRNKPASKKDDDPLPEPYSLRNPDWRKASIVTRQPCGFAKNDHECVVLAIPLKPWSRLDSGSKRTNMLAGEARVILDTQTGLILSLHKAQVIEGPSSSYKQDVLYKLKSLKYGAARDQALFQLPPGLKEVKELSEWNASRIKKQLVGNPAPLLTATDIQGQPVSLASLKGKTVLLDFFTTWCGPCRADGPSLDKLYAKYGGKTLAIVGISVSEDRSTVEQFLTEHPHKYPIVLTSENQLPRPFQIGVFPTYVIVAPDGTIAGATEDTQGFSELQHLLTKAGMEPE